MIYFVATPIGNLDEITYRAVEILKSVECIFCEDTRHTRILLSAYQIDKPLYSYHKFNEKEQLDFVLKKAASADVAIVSDAGTPCVCDPGNILVNALKNSGIGYTLVGSSCAFVSAFALSGFVPPLTFCGFLPEKNVDKDRLLQSVNTNSCLAFYVSVHNLKKDVDYLFGKLGARKACLVKELTKIHEKVRFFDLPDVPDDDKGEFVLLLDKSTDGNPLCLLSAKEHVERYILAGLTKNEAIKQAAKDRGVSKNDVYKEVL